MGVRLEKATESDAELIFDMQIQAFSPLLDKYKDYETNPACESIDRVIARIKYQNGGFYKIIDQSTVVGAVCVHWIEKTQFWISPIFIQPKHQGKGYAQQALRLIEQQFPQAISWELATLMGEERNCYLYEKLGYTRTGEQKPLNENTILIFYKKDNRYLDLAYLSEGNDKQRIALHVLNELRLFEILDNYSPILVGTIPIDIDIPGSDLDVICRVEESDFGKVEALLKGHFLKMAHFACTDRYVQGIPRMVCSFEYKGWPVEVFAQPIPSQEQNGYRHMIIEDRILRQLGEEGRNRIRKLKMAGFKTEPAFGQLLKLREDPYEMLLTMSDWDDNQLTAFLRKQGLFA